MRRIVALVVIMTALWAGAVYLFRRERRQYARGRRHFLVTQGGSQLRPTGDEIRDAVVSVMMGGIVLDLRETQITQRPARIDILSVMGGVELVVPKDWKVQVDVQPVMAGVQDRRAGTVDSEQPVDLVLSGRAVMSGLDIASQMPCERGQASA